jgi:hypothetical protein
MTKPWKAEIIFGFMIVVSITVLMAAAHAEMYTWTDKQGNFHATDDPTQVPEEYRQSSEPPSNEQPVEADWVPYGYSSKQRKNYYNKRSIVKTGNVVTVTTKMIYDPPENSGIRKEGGPYFKIASVEIDAMIDCREQTWKVLARRYFGNQGEPLDFVTEWYATLPPDEILVISDSNPKAVALYKEVCTR